MEKENVPLFFDPSFLCLLVNDQVKLGIESASALPSLGDDLRLICIDRCARTVRDGRGIRTNRVSPIASTGREEAVIHREPKVDLVVSCSKSSRGESARWSAGCGSGKCGIETVGNPVAEPAVEHHSLHPAASRTGLAYVVRRVEANIRGSGNSNSSRCIIYSSDSGRIRVSGNSIHPVGTG